MFSENDYQLYIAFSENDDQLYIAFSRNISTNTHQFYYLSAKIINVQGGPISNFVIVLSQPAYWRK